MRHSAYTLASVSLASLLVVATLLLPLRPFVRSVSAAYLGPHAVMLSNNSAGVSGVTYATSFTIVTPGTLGSVEIQFCANSSLVDDPCIAPAGLDASGVVLSNETGVTDFTRAPNSTSNDVILQHTPAVVGAIQISVDLQNMVNPSGEGSYFAKILTHASNDASGAIIDNGGVAFDINKSVSISTEVPPYLTFCTGVSIASFDCSTADGDFANLGDLSSTATAATTTQLMAATNAENGYAIRVSGTTLTSGNNTLPTMQSEAAHPGTSQFGLNLRANTSPQVGINPSGGGSAVPTTAYGTVNRFRFNDGEVVATANGVQDYKRFTASYVVDVAKDQAPGVYSTTLTYICLANF